MSSLPRMRISKAKESNALLIKTNISRFAEAYAVLNIENSHLSHK